MIRKTILAVTALVAVAAPLALAATPAEAATSPDRRPCVTAGEWSQIHARQSKATVARILDGPGTLWWDANFGMDQFRTYRPCASFGNNMPLVVWYDAYSYGNGFRVWDKYRATNHDMPGA
jgi:hypothetical protein